MPAGTSDDLARRRTAVAAEIERHAPALESLAADVHRLPELGCREVETVARLAGELEEEGFSVTLGVSGMPTAVRAERGPGGGPAIAFLAEYDAIPGLGHAAGHNLLVAATVGAAVALARVAADLPGRVVVVGAPAEETIGGKVVLAERGGFDGIDAALLAHPASENRATVRSLASWSVEVVFEGRSAHAVIAPEEGINALDAVVQLFVARDALLKSLHPEARMPGIVVEGGVRPNIVPERARARFSLRAHDARYLVDTVLTRFREVVEGVARATGTRATITPVDNLYDELVPNPVLADLWSAHARELGVPLEGDVGRPLGSLDVGRLSQRIPVLHPLFRVADEATHTRSFALAAASPAGFAAALRAARLLALTGLDLLADPQALARARSAHAHLAPRERFAAIDAALVTGEEG